MNSSIQISKSTANLYLWKMRVYFPKWVLLSFFALLLSTGAKWSEDLFEYSKNIEIFSSVYKEVIESYVDEIPPAQLREAAIKSMLKTLDPYTVFFSEYQAEEAMIERYGEYGGVGCQVVERDGLPMVSKIIKGFGFDNAGIRLGDKVFKVGKLELTDQPVDEMMQYFRGAPNTKFEVTIIRGKDTFQKEVTRTRVQSKSVSHFGFIDSSHSGDFKGIGYIKLDEFGRNCSKEIESALNALLKSKQLEGLILDLRNNGGGLLNEAVNIVGFFTEKNLTVVNLIGKKYKGPSNWKTSQDPIAPELPLAVLVNNRSASASEVVSGSLQDLDRAVIIGQNSFGKGLVQNYQSLPYRTQMKLTTARYYTPSGRCIQRLHYEEKDSKGKAKILKNEEKKSFKTKNGRIVFEGGGIDPDVETDAFQGVSILGWLKDQYVIFDWANLALQQFKNSMANDNEILNSFIDYSKNQGFEHAVNNINTIIASSGKDSILLKEIGNVQFSSESFDSKIKTAVNSNMDIFLFELKKALLIRIDDPKSNQNLLKLDKEILLSSQLLHNPKRIKSILNP